MERRSLDLVAAARANALLEAGAEWASASTLSINAAGRCMRPKLVTIAHSNVYGRRFAHEKIFNASMFWDIDVACRQCDACRETRKRLWTARAIRETKAAQRTWFGTLTMSPHHRMRCLNTARHRFAKSGDFETLAEPDQFRRLCAEWNLEITLWLKRIRERSEATIRYLLVFEKHQSGDPHVHFLMHQIGELRPVTKRQIRREWQCGITHARLLPEGDLKHVFYTCKYIQKQALNRIRASRFYGDPPAPERNPVAPELEPVTTPQLAARAEQPQELTPHQEGQSPTVSQETDEVPSLGGLGYGGG